MSVNYQNPATVNLVLDSEQVAIDATTSQPLVREFVVPQESIKSFDALSKIGDILEKVLEELKAMRILLESDVPPQMTESDEIMELAEGAEENMAEGIEET
jgi:hypothetical protein